MAKFVVLFSLLSLAVALSSGHSGGCVPGWVSFKDSCYYVETLQRYTYDEAKDLCESSKSTLVAINDLLENKFVKAFTRGKYNLWIGLNDLEQEGDFHWDADVDLKYKNWAPGQPSNYKMKQHCAQLMPNPLGMWKDVQCSNTMGYVCEKLPECTPIPVGVESGAITNSQMTSSSYYSTSYMAYHGRLNCQTSYCGWIAKNSAAGEWLQVNLGTSRTVKQVATQSRANYSWWVKTYTLCYSDNGLHCTFVTSHAGHPRTFTGNSDKDTVVYQPLSEDQVFTARYVRFVAQSWNGRIAMRVEVYACE